MTVRNQSGELRSEIVEVTDDTGAPWTGALPTCATLYVDGTAAPAATVTALALPGVFRVDLASAPSRDVVFQVDRGGSLATRYVTGVIGVGGYVDRLDTTISSRATAAAVAALGTPAQTAALADVSALILALGTPAQGAALTALTTTVGSPAQAAALAAALAQLLDAIATRAAPGDLVPGYEGTVS